MMWQPAAPTIVIESAAEFAISRTVIFGGGVRGWFRRGDPMVGRGLAGVMGTSCLVVRGVECCGDGAPSSVGKWLWVEGWGSWRWGWAWEGGSCFEASSSSSEFVVGEWGETCYKTNKIHRDINESGRQASWLKCFVSTSILRVHVSSIWT